MQKNYLFYDIETSGLNPCFDQILQFAYILTDDELNEIEREEILIKPHRDLVPSPEAMLTHGFSIQHFIDNGICENKALKKIHELVNTPNTVSIGYNSLSFDDEFLRFGFYRNLLPVYTHQYANGCSRADLYPITVIYHLFKSEILTWPKLENGTTLRLEHINSANDLADGDAHDAMVDTAACVGLAKAFRKELATWDYLLASFNKGTDLDRINKFPEAFPDVGNGYKLALLFNGKCGKNNFYQMPVLGLGGHNHYRNQSLWLRLDSPQLLETNFDNLAEKTGGLTYRKKAGETPLLLPPNERHKKYLTKERLEIVYKVLKFFAENLDLLEAIANYHRDYKYPAVAGVDIDAALYVNGFLTNDEQRHCAEFNRGSVATKVGMLDKMRSNNLREQMLRLLGRNFFDELPDYLQDEFDEYQKQAWSEKSKIIDYKGANRLTPKQALARIDELLTQGGLDVNKITILQGLKEYLK